MLHTYHRCNSDMGNDNSGCLDEWPKPKKSKTEEIYQSPGWECLPAVILDNVFEHLSFNDIVNASSTCRNWRQSLYHPRLWQHVTFNIVDIDNIPKIQYLRSMVGHIASDVTIKFNSMLSSCVSEFLLLLEYFMYNNNLQSLVLEPSHCHVLMPDSMIKMLNTNPLNVTLSKLCSQRPMTKLSIGCNEDLLEYVPKLLQLLAESKPEKLTTLGLASVKDDPINYFIYYCDPNLFLPFRSLQIISLDYDSFNDNLLKSLHSVNDLHRLVIHIHGIWENHPGTTEEAWKLFRRQQPNCLLRLSLIHAFDEVNMLHDVILKDNMPLSHLKVLFCESMNQTALETLIKYSDTFVSLVWIDSIDSGQTSYSLLTETDYMAVQTPQNLILLAWQCKKLEEIVILGYKYFEEDWIGVAKLRSDTLKKLQVAKSDVLKTRYNFLKDMQKILGKRWSPVDQTDLHPVLLDPIAGDSDEYLMPLLLADLQ